MIKQWSHSRFKTYQECPYKAKLKFIDRLQEPSNPAMERGIDIHKKAEDFLTTPKMELPPELLKMEKEMKALKKEKTLEVELELAFNLDWERVDWFASDVWWRAKVDALYFNSATGNIVVIDHKTGKVNDYESQASLYALAAFLATPGSGMPPRVTAEFWFLDHGQKDKHQYKRKDVAEMKAYWASQTRAMLNDTRFAPRPGNYCRWCHFRKSNGGPCAY